MRSFQLSTVSDFHSFRGSSKVRSNSFYLFDNLLSLGNLSKNNVLSIKMRTGNRCYEKLGSVCVWSSVGHRQQSWNIVLVLKVFIIKFGSINGLTSPSIEHCKVSALQHKFRDDPVKDCPLEMERLPRSTLAFFTSAETSEVL